MEEEGAAASGMDFLKVRRTPLKVQYKHLTEDEKLHQKASKAVRKFLNNRENKCRVRFLKFFKNLFQVDEDLRNLYGDGSNKGHYTCPVCRGINEKDIMSFTLCSNVVVHCWEIEETETEMKAAHCGYGLAIMKLWESNTFSLFERRVQMYNEEIEKRKISQDQTTKNPECEQPVVID